MYPHTNYQRFTYSVSFAALLVATAKEVDFWTHGNDAFNGFLMYLILPCCLILTNAFKVEVLCSRWMVLRNTSADRALDIWLD